MYGYVLPDKPDLRVRELETYKAYYCGVCRCIGRRHGHTARFALSYDCVFLGALLSSLAEGEPRMERFRCMAHPCGRRGASMTDAAVEYAADLSVALMRRKALDDWRDERSPAALLGSRRLRGPSGRVSERYPEMARRVAESIGRLADLERAGCGQLDQPADAFGKALEQALLQGAATVGAMDGEREALGWMGYNIGRWVYSIDAYDDMREDHRKGRYNPWLAGRAVDGPGLEGYAESVRGRAGESLLLALAEASKAYGFLRVRRNGGLLENVLFLGMMKVTDSVLAGGRDGRRGKARRGWRCARRFGDGWVGMG
ncbi:MAG: DUF5685 family protein [Oscillospiraceae bacterium]|nr:DUF5685 family protein [Oscillospiraceae bacterium]